MVFAGKQREIDFPFVSPDLEHPRVTETNIYVRCYNFENLKVEERAEYEIKAICSRRDDSYKPDNIETRHTYVVVRFWTYLKARYLPRSRNIRYFVQKCGTLSTPATKRQT
jgi:hypothetical protein